MKKFLFKSKLLVAVVLIVIIGLIFYDLLIVHRKYGINLGAEIDSVSFSSNDRYLAVTSFGGSGFSGVQVYDVAKESFYKIVMTFYPPFNPAESPPGAYFSNDGKQLIVHSPMDGESKAVQEFMAFDSTSLAITNQKPKAYISPVHANWGRACWAEINNNDEGQYFVTIHMSDHSYAIKVPDSSYQFAIDTINHRLAIASYTGDIYIFDLQKRKTISHFSCEQHPFNPKDIYFVTTSLAWFPKQHLIWASNDQGRSVFWDSLHHKVKADIQIPLVITCAAINHTGDSIAFGTIDGQVHVIQTKQLVKAVNNGNTVHFFLTEYNGTN